MEVVVPWQELIDLIEPHYPKTRKKGGRPPYPLATMLRFHLLQQWYALSDLSIESGQPQWSQHHEATSTLCCAELH
jgi:IS5 family transposase